MVPDRLDLRELAARTVPPLSAARVAVYVEAAALAMEQHHDAPRTGTLDRAVGVSELVLDWAKAEGAEFSYDEQEMAEDGACALALALMDQQGLRVVKRLEKGTGADFLFLLLPSKGADDEDFVRLEVSGILRGVTVSEHMRRVRLKLSQLARGGDTPGMAVVVAFELPSLYQRELVS